MTGCSSEEERRSYKSEAVGSSPTSPTKGGMSEMTKIEWVREIVEAADRAGVPVFMKDNLTGWIKKRQEMPE